MEPFGQWRDNWHMSVLASILANVNRGVGTPVISPSEFMYEDPEDVRTRKDKEMLAWLDMKVKH